MVELGAATLAYAILVAGVAVRKNRRVHPVVMLTGLGIDLALVVLLQVQRSVIQDAMTDEYTLLQQGHILASTIAVVLYFPTIYFGARQWAGSGGPRGRQWHIRSAIAAFSFRSLGFVLMWSHSAGF